jgi:hypothetical protein
MKMPEHPDQEMSTRAMLLLGAGGTLVVTAVLGLSLLSGVGGKAGRAGHSQPAETIAVPAAAGTGGSTGGTPGNGLPAGGATVPELVGVDSMTATARLAGRRISVAAVIRVPSALAPGQVVRTYPRAGATVPAGGHVTLYVAGTATGTRVAVPYLIGVTAEEARSIAAQYGLSLVILRGTTTVSAQTPNPGAIVVRGSAVLVSLG